MGCAEPDHGLEGTDRDWHGPHTLGLDMVHVLLTSQLGPLLRDEIAGLLGQLRGDGLGIVDVLLHELSAEDGLLLAGVSQLVVLEVDLSRGLGP